MFGRVGGSARVGRWFWLRRCQQVGTDVEVGGPVIVRGRGEFCIGDRVVFDAAVAPIELNADAGGRIVIGDDVYLGPGTSIEACELVTVQASARLGAFCKILDNHRHELSGDRELRPASLPVTIGEGARVGARSSILPGGSLGAGSELLADSVLSRRVPGGGVLLGGVPARPVTL